MCDIKRLCLNSPCHYLVKRRLARRSNRITRANLQAPGQRRQTRHRYCLLERYVAFHHIVLQPAHEHLPHLAVLCQRLCLVRRTGRVRIPGFRLLRHGLRARHVRHRHIPVVRHAQLVQRTLVRVHMPVTLRTRTARTRNLRNCGRIRARRAIRSGATPPPAGGRLTLYHLQRKLLLCHVTVPPLRYRLFLL